MNPVHSLKKVVYETHCAFSLVACSMSQPLLTSPHFTHICQWPASNPETCGHGLVSGGWHGFAVWVWSTWLFLDEHLLVFRVGGVSLWCMWEGIVTALLVMAVVSAYAKFAVLLNVSNFAVNPGSENESALEHD